MLHFTFSTLYIYIYIYSSQLADYVEDNISVTVGITAWHFVVCLLASRLLYGGGLYVEVLGPSVAGESGWDGFLWRWVLRRVSKIAFIQVVVCGGFCVDMEPL